MPLIIGTTPNSQWQALTPLLNHLGWQNQQENPEKGYQNTENVDENTQYLLLHSRPELAVAHAMDAGASPERALTEWSNAAEQLLAFYKRHRRHAVMVDAGSTALASKGLIEWLRENRPAFSKQAPWPKDAPELSIPAPSTPLNQLLATQLVAQDQGLVGLLAQLEAASIPLTNSTQPKLDIAALHTELKQQKNAPQWEQENELLLAQLHKVQEELESYYHKAQNGSKTCEELEAQTKQLKEQKQALETELQSTQRELAQQKSNAVAGEEALEQSKAELTRAEQALSEAQSQNEEQHKDVLEENDLILKQLFQVQEELEKYYLENKNLQRLQETTAAEHKAAIQTKNEKLKRFSQEKRTLKDENKELTKTLERTEAALVELRANAGSGSAVKSLVKTLRGVSRSSRLVKEQVQLVQSSDLFDERWYLRQNPDVAPEFEAAAEHYVLHGGQEGRAPGPNFSSKKYLDKYPDVAESGQNPLVHYLLHGKAEGRKP